jgi:hypothetical protein
MVSTNVTLVPSTTCSYRLNLRGELRIVPALQIEFGAMYTVTLRVDGVWSSSQRSFAADEPANPEYKPDQFATFLNAKLGWYHRLARLGARFKNIRRRAKGCQTVGYTGAGKLRVPWLENTVYKLHLIAVMASAFLSQPATRLPCPPLPHPSDSVAVRQRSPHSRPSQFTSVPGLLSFHVHLKNHWRHAHRPPPSSNSVSD